MDGFRSLEVLPLAAGYWLFTPANDDPNDLALQMGGGLVPGAFGLRSNQVTSTTPGSNGLANVHMTDPALLIIFGHANYGAGIGSHKTHYGAERMVNLLSGEGLSPQQKNLTIFLWACNTGVAMGRVIRDKDPYAKRFAERLAEAGFSHTRVIGVAGFISASADRTVLKYNMKTNQIDRSASPRAPTDVTRQIAYSVESGSAARVSGGSWKSFLNPVSKICEIIGS
jgi:hypothetical protein